jgi:hypothetical protein
MTILLISNFCNVINKTGEIQAHTEIHAFILISNKCTKLGNILSCRTVGLERQSLEIVEEEVSISMYSQSYVTNEGVFIYYLTDV